ncbi:MAG: threonylcarbamoyl-AMP synthase [Tatlockia sp.]|nr:threonylcarbamoyl-AMP synthase [Tatlockia sp.]
MSTITKDINLALTNLQQGNIVAIPTETVYGLAANAENEQAIHKIFAMKNRPLNHPLIMHVLDDWDLTQWVSFIPEYAQQLIKKFWPGPLTLVLQTKAGKVNPLVTGGQNTVALRCPKHPIAQQLLAEAGFPLVAPSANPFGKISPTTAQHVQHSFKNEDLLILDGGRCQVGIESTIVSAIYPEGYEILRPGLINESHLASLLPGRNYKRASDIRVPGKLESHYQPEKTLYCFNDIQAIHDFIAQKTHDSVFVLTFTALAEQGFKFYYHLPNSPQQAAFELYYQLREADQSLASCIAIELPPDEDLWQGVRERILKAGNL